MSHDNKARRANNAKSETNLQEVKVESTYRGWITRAWRPKNAHRPIHGIRFTLKDKISMMKFLFQAYQHALKAGEN